MSLLYSIFVPHPPILVPEIGKGEEAKCSKTLEAYRKVTKQIFDSQIEVVVIISPHALLLRDGVTILKDNIISGDFAQG